MITNQEILDANISKRKTGMYSYNEVIRMMNLARSYGAKNVRYEAINILQEELHDTMNSDEADYAERCIKRIQNIKS